MTKTRTVKTPYLGISLNLIELPIGCKRPLFHRFAAPNRRVSQALAGKSVHETVQNFLL
jgi:hypothetical protein